MHCHRELQTVLACFCLLCPSMQPSSILVVLRLRPCWGVSDAARYAWPLSAVVLWQFWRGQPQRHLPTWLCDGSPMHVFQCQLLQWPLSIVPHRSSFKAWVLSSNSIARPWPHLHRLKMKNPGQIGGSLCWKSALEYRSWVRHWVSFLSLLLPLSFQTVKLATCTSLSSVVVCVRAHCTHVQIWGVSQC